MKFDLGHINKIAVVNIALGADENIFHFLQLKKSKDEIKFEKKGERYRDFDALVKKIANYPVLLHFTGKGILNRKAVRQENYRHSVLLNGNMDAFYFSDYLEKKTVFSSVIRKDVVDGFIARFVEHKLQIISISSGPFHTAFLNGVIQENYTSQSQSIFVDDINLQFENGELLGFEKVSNLDQLEKRSVLLGDETISRDLLPCAATGAAFFNPNEKIVFPDNDSIFIDGVEEAKQKNIFTRFGMGMMLFFLTILTINYFYLGHLNQVVMDNSVYLMEYDEQLSRIADLEEEINRKEKLLQSSGLLNKNFLSFYLMEIANSVPDEIAFDQIVVRPLKEEIKNRKKIAFEEHLVLIDGRSETSHELSQWIAAIEEKDWLSKVDILNYDYIKNEGVFELEMVVY